MLINLCAKLLLFFFISSKKFHAKITAQSGFPRILFLETIGIFIPGRNLPCLSLLSSTMHSSSLEIPKKFNAVVAFAGEPYPMILLFLFFSFKIFFLTLSLILYTFLANS